MSEELARRGDLRMDAVTSMPGEAGPMVSLARDDEEIVLSPYDLRWLITTGSPAALHAIGGAPQIRTGGRDAEGS